MSKETEGWRSGFMNEQTEGWRRIDGEAVERRRVMVKRYEAWRAEDDYHYRVDLVEHVNGQYVLASDYDALAAELEAVVRQRDEASEALAKAAEEREKYKVKLQDADYNLGRATDELKAVKGTDHYQRSLDEMHLRYNVEAELDALKAELEKWQREAIKHQAAADKVGESLLNLHEWGYHCKEEFDALTAELARVKAESLRVVKVGEPCEISKISICACFLHLGVLYRLYSFSHDEFGAWQISDHTEHLFTPDTIVQPVRLEPWENCDETD